MAQPDPALDSRVCGNHVGRHYLLLHLAGRTVDGGRFDVWSWNGKREWGYLVGWLQAVNVGVVFPGLGYVRRAVMAVSTTRDENLKMEKNPRTSIVIRIYVFSRAQSSWRSK